MKFDVVIGNPPYEKGMHKKFTLMAVSILKPGGQLTFITPASFMQGPGSTGYRSELFNSALIHQIDVLPTGTFTTINDAGKAKNMLLAVAVMYGTAGLSTTAPITITRMLNNVQFTWTDQSVNGSDLRLYYDDIGRSIWHTCAQYSTKFRCSKNDDCRYAELSGSNINIGAKNNIGYVGDGIKLGGINGRSIISGKVVDADGTYERIHTQLETSSAKRWIFKTNQPYNLARYMETKLVGILMTMTGFDSNTTRSNIGLLPMVELTGTYATDDDFNNAVYAELNLTADQILWIESFGTNK